MTELNATDKVKANLRCIVELHARLLTQAVHSANDPLMPGGLAMVELAYVASPTEWSERIDYLERVLEIHPDLRDEDDDWEPPLQTLLFWSEQWRTERGYPLEGRRATIGTEAGFLRGSVDWAWENELHFDEFARDVAVAKRRVEDTLRDGDRAERTRVVCDRCDGQHRLIKVYGAIKADDRWKCPVCKHLFDPDDFKRAHAKQLRSDSAEKFVLLPDAIGTLRAQERSERTIRKWLAPPIEHVKDECTECGKRLEAQEYAACPVELDDDEVCGGLLRAIYRGDRDAVVESYCEITTHKVWVWWPDLWRRHLSTATRKRTHAA